MLRFHLYLVATTAKVPSQAGGYEPLNATSVPSGGFVQLGSM